MDSFSNSATTVSAKPGFRPDIAALRALAVTAVALFHFGVPGLPGGFVGVDVFFVISGYLMTSILTAAAQRDRLDVLGFYLGRIKRIVPALVVVTLCTLAAGYALLLPDAYRQLAWSAVWADSFIINVAFARTTDYFAQSADQSWFLHCWSLAVEIQFYLVIPFVVLGSLRFARRRGVQGGLLAVAALSLAASYVQTRMDPASAFYVPSTRAWEFAAGGLVSTLRTPSARRGALAAAGLTLILAAVVLYDSTMAYPGLWPAVPVLGTALVIWVRVENRAISATAVQYLGDISYSVYLWHWPVLLACRILLPRGGLLPFAVEVAASLALSALTYRYVETPFRSRRRMMGFRPTVAIAAGLAAVALASTTVVTFDGFPGRVPADIRRIVAVAPPMSDWRYETCFLRTDQAASDLAPECLSKSGDLRPKVLLWGDSTVADLYPGLKAQPWADAFSIEQITAGSCAHYGTPVAPTLTHCRSLQDIALAHVLASRPDYVVMSMAQTTFPIDPHSASTFEQRIGPLIGLISRLKAAGIAHVIVTGPMPFWPAGLPTTFARASFDSGVIETTLPLPNAQRIRGWDETVRAAVKDSGAEYLSFIDDLCPDDRCASLVPGAANPALMQFDTLHFTLRGSAYVVNHFLAPLLGEGVGLSDDRGDYSFDPIQSDDGRPRGSARPPATLPQHYPLIFGTSFTIDLTLRIGSSQQPYATIIQNYDPQLRGFSIEYTADRRAALFVRMEDGSIYADQFDVAPDAEHRFKLVLRDGHPTLTLDEKVVAHTGDGRMAQSSGDVWVGASSTFGGRDLNAKLQDLTIAGDVTRR